MNGQSVLQHSLQDYSHLDLSPFVLADTVEQKGGGGSSDVFLSRLSTSWRPRSDPIIMRLLNFEDGLNSSPEQVPSESAVSLPTGTKATMKKRLRFWSKSDRRSMEKPATPVTLVAVKRHRVWGQPDYRIEKVTLIPTIR